MNLRKLLLWILWPIHSKADLAIVVISIVIWFAAWTWLINHKPVHPAFRASLPVLRSQLFEL